MLWTIYFMKSLKGRIRQEKRAILLKIFSDESLNLLIRKYNVGRLNDMRRRQGKDNKRSLNERNFMNEIIL